MCGDTLKLDAGTGYDTYLWNDCLSEEQQLDVTEPGLYWVNVTQGKRMGTDSIFIDVVTESLTVMPNDTCDTIKEVVFFEQYSLMLPCYYTVSFSVGEDSDSFRARIIEDNHEIVDIQYERDSRFKQDTIQSLPDVYRGIFPYKSYYDKKAKICSAFGEGIGVLYYENYGAKYIDIEGKFLSKEGDVYFEILNIQYQIEREKEVKSILSTLKF